MEIVLVVWFIVLLCSGLGAGLSERPARSLVRSGQRTSWRVRTPSSPGPTAATAAALMIGLALVTFILVLANGIKGSNRDAIERQVTAQYLLTSTDGSTPFALAQAMRSRGHQR